MAFLATEGRNAAVNGVAAATYVSMHTADPGANGTNEITGGTPAYARKQVTWGTAANGTRTITGSVTFDIPSGVNVSHFGIWTALTGGTYYGSDALRDNNGNAVVESFGGQGTYTLTSASITINAT